MDSNWVPPCSPRAVAKIVQQGGYWTRLDIAEALGREKTTHVIETIERAVRAGLINRIEGQDDQGRDAWIYTIEVSQASFAVILDGHR